MTSLRTTSAPVFSFMRWREPHRRISDYVDVARLRSFADRGAVFKRGCRRLDPVRYLVEGQRWRRFLELVGDLPRHRRMSKSVSGGTFASIRSRQPKLSIKYLNPQHIANGFSSSERARAMIHHYTVLRTSFDKAILSSIIGKGVLLWTDQTDSGLHTLRLIFSHPTDNEGELTIEYMFEHNLLHVLSFTLVPGYLVDEVAQPTLLISRIQGSRDHRDDARIAMKSLHGLSAPALLIAATYGIAEGLGLDRIVGVSAARQVCHSPGEADLRSAYDMTFNAMGATEFNGFHTIALPFEDKPIAATKSSNRGRVRAQRELKRAIAVATRTRLGLVAPQIRMQNYL